MKRSYFKLKRFYERYSIITKQAGGPLTSSVQQQTDSLNTVLSQSLPQFNVQNVKIHKKKL